MNISTIEKGEELKRTISYSEYSKLFYKRESTTPCNPCFICQKQITDKDAKMVELNCSTNEIALIEGMIPVEQSQG
jgi:hypothetical protein